MSEQANQPTAVGLADRSGPRRLAPDAFGNPHPQLRLVADRLHRCDLLCGCDLIGEQPKGDWGLCACVPFPNDLSQGGGKFGWLSLGQMIPYVCDGMSFEIFGGLFFRTKLRERCLRGREFFLHRSAFHLRRNIRSFRSRCIIGRGLDIEQGPSG